jgi:mono/diheme cytochrome c family protein
MAQDRIRIQAKDRTVEDVVRSSVVDRQLYAKRRRWIAIPLLVVGVLALVVFAFFRQVSAIDVPEDFANDQDHFKYGSIGSDTLEGNGVPYWLWRALPGVCADKLPPGGLAAIGVLQEPGMDRPIGFSKRRTGFVDSVGLNCAACHTASVRASADSPPKYYLAAASHQLDLWAYFNFLFECGASPNFTVDRVMAEIESMTKLSPAEKVFYRIAIQRTPAKLAAQKAVLSWIGERPQWGPGRVDTFNPYRSLIFHVPVPKSSIGTADFMTVWSQDSRSGLFVHWDGNNPSVEERNLSAALGAGATPATLDMPRLNRVRKWLWDVRPPAYPFPVDYQLAAAGKPLYAQQCAYCHDPQGKDYGKVTPNEYIGTDPNRSDAFDAEMAGLMNRIGEGYPWRFRNFRPTGGYANHPIDGAWLRAPYLHNGSVPSLRALLSPPAARPRTFYKGNDVYDQKDLGFVSTQASSNGRRLFAFDTAEPGNGNGGHDYGTTLTPPQTDALLEYLKTL